MGGLKQLIFWNVRRSACCRTSGKSHVRMENSACMYTHPETQPSCSEWASSCLCVTTAGNCLCSADARLHAAGEP